MKKIETWYLLKAPAVQTIREPERNPEQIKIKRRNKSNIRNRVNSLYATDTRLLPFHMNSQKKKRKNINYRRGTDEIENQKP